MPDDPEPVALEIDDGQLGHTEEIDQENNDG